MSLKPVVAKDEPVTVARCPRCRGTALLTVDRFLDDDDENRADLEKLRANGFAIQSMTLKKANFLDFCECDESVQQAQAATAPQPKVLPTGRPTLTMKVTRRSAN